MSDSACNTANLVYGNATSGDDNFTMTSTNLEANKIYKVSASGPFSGSGTVDCSIYIDDGTNTIAMSRVNRDASSSTTNFAQSIFGYIKYDTFQSSKTFNVKVTRNSGTGTCGCYSNGSGVCTLSIEEVYPSVAMPQIINSVYTNYPGQIREVSGTVKSDGTILYAGTGDWTVTTPATGRYNITPSPAFASTNYSCTASRKDALGIIGMWVNNAKSTTLIQIDVANTSGTNVNSDVEFSCKGPK
jgi:hypothetical protein